MKIEVGKVYQTKNGSLVEVVFQDPKTMSNHNLGALPYNRSAQGMNWYNENGQHWISTLRPDLDIVSEYFTPKQFVLDNVNISSSTTKPGKREAFIFHFDRTVLEHDPRGDWKKATLVLEK